MREVDPKTSDVVIVGAGFAGAALAHVLVKAGLSLTLVDRYESCRPCFKAEKVEPDQADILRELGLFHLIAPTLTRISSVASAYRGRVIEIAHLEQYGADFHEMVNALRKNLPGEVRQEVARVQSVDCSGSEPRVLLDDGRTLSTRLVVLAAGTSPSILAAAGLEREDIRKGHSLAFGFDLRPSSLGKEACPIGSRFDSMTYYSERPRSLYDFLTLFPIGDRLRANLFTSLNPRSREARDLLSDPQVVVDRTLPKLRHLTGPLEQLGKTDAQRIDLYRVRPSPQGGVVAIGDAHQSVCPATGTGLSKVLTDVQVAGESIPRWLSAGDTGVETLDEYYSDPRKIKCDQDSIAGADYHYSFATNQSFRWHIHRFVRYQLAAVRGHKSNFLGANRSM